MPRVQGGGRSGPFRHRLLLERKQAVKVIDGDGNDVTPWLPVTSVWAEMSVPSVLAASGARGERQQSGQLEQLRPHAITLRASTRSLGIDHNCRFRLGDRILEIRDVTDLGELHIHLRVDAVEKVY